MTKEELLNAFGIKQPTDSLLNHPKVLELLNYCNINDATIYEGALEIKEEAFKVLLENIHSFETLLVIMHNTGVVLSLEYHPKEIATFYNLYNPKKLQYSEDANILITDEYLKYASKEWTEDIFFNEERVLHINNQNFILKEKSAFDDTPTYLLNLKALEEAQDMGLLKEALAKFME